jgi:hypothetical protein
MRERWVFRPYVARIQLAGASLVSIITLVDIIVFFFEARRFHPSLGLNLCALTFTIVVFGLGAGAIQGYRVIRQARSRLEAGDRNAALTLVSRQFFLVGAMAGLGCGAIIVSINFLIELLRTR